MSYHYINIKKKDILNWKFFLLQTTYFHESLEGLNSCLAQSDGELLPRVNFEGAKCWLILVYEP